MSLTPSRSHPNGFPPRAALPNGLNGHQRRGASLTREATGGSLGAASAVEVEEEDTLQALLRARLEESENSIARLFGDIGVARRSSPTSERDAGAERVTTAGEPEKPAAPLKKAVRMIDDDYGDDEDEEDDELVEKETPVKVMGKTALPNGLSPHTVKAIFSPQPPPKPIVVRTSTASSSDQVKSSEDVRKQLEEDKQAAADTAKRSFQSLFYTWENDRDAMLEQQKLDELDREVDNELASQSNGDANAQQNAGGPTSAPAGHGTLGSADLGASSLTLKHLIARIDAKRNMVKASDNQLRTLISEVRKGRSKWASEDKVGQEELYEAAEKVLMELKANTEYAQPFLQRVSKREAPDYVTVIKHPMDIGTMIKKLKQLGYKSKKEFVDDLGLIWANCLKYNSSPEHPFRKKALYMRKETDKLIPLIPEIVVKDRAEVEAEERNHHSLEVDESDDDDDAPLASRGRKAPKKGSKGAPSSARKAPSVAVEDASRTPAPDVKTALNTAAHLKNDFLRAESEAHDASSAGFSTPPPPGTISPMANGTHGNGVADVMEVDGLGHSVLSTHDDPDEDDTEYKTWKQVTMKDRAIAAAERNRLFHGDRLNADEPALLRSKAGMRRWLRQQKLIAPHDKDKRDESQDAVEEAETLGIGETLAEGIEKDEDSTLPDYYDPLSTIPDLREKWRWTTDSEGHVVQQSEEWMRMFPKAHYKSPDGMFTQKMEANMRQMQETRKICSKIGLVKQMQLQGQTYQNQFMKYEPAPFLEQDIRPTVVSEAGPLMSPWVNRAALQRSVGKIFYHAGFEDFQPSALDTVTDLASEYFSKMVAGFKTFREQPRRDGSTAPFTFEEQVLHTMHEQGVELDALEAYVGDDVERLSTKLGVVHERMKSHLADLLRPALGDHAGADGVGAFQDGSEQFVGGDFAEDLDEDFFGFRELGLAAEFGLENMSVPLHLLQNRMHTAYQAQHQGPAVSTGLLFPPPSPYEPVTMETVGREVGLVQEFFRARLRANGDEALVEDEELPAKQRYPKPRLPPTGKISSPRKRPIREQQQAAKKKRKLDEAGLAEERGGEVKKLGKPIGALKLKIPDRGVLEEPGKDGGEVNGALISPESIAGH
ncbi:hypothetical protein LTR62_008142 [Meristemomyces frigidus]|uniref:SAGA complex subunit Spt7 n=1 Tax=Meristemomyces frigidus TaxID=1508187 RepID=A0AAN7TAC6_9PEZI|nr:hypothetical protein LTR62_008142 [Meristemomyces frigidus]